MTSPRRLRSPSHMSLRLRRAPSLYALNARLSFKFAAERVFLSFRGSYACLDLSLSPSRPFLCLLSLFFSFSLLYSINCLNRSVLLSPSSSLASSSLSSFVSLPSYVSFHASRVLPLPMVLFLFSFLPRLFLFRFSIDFLVRAPLLFSSLQQFLVPFLPFICLDSSF